VPKISHLRLHRLGVSQLSVVSADGHVRSLEEIEREVLRLALAVSDGSATKAAAQLKIGRSTLYRKLDEFGLRRS
jgi:DNA-binding NtrC family response regulator